MARGGSKGKSKRTIYDLSREPITTLDETSTWFEEMRTGNDRVCAVIGSAALDITLRFVIRESLVSYDEDPDLNSLFEAKGAILADFSARIEMAHALGLISSDEKADLDRIRRIRNAFAHAPKSISFQTPEVADQCMALANGAPLTDQENTARNRFVRIIHLRLIAMVGLVDVTRKMNVRPKPMAMMDRFEELVMQRAALREKPAPASTPEPQSQS